MVVEHTQGVENTNLTKATTLIRLRHNTTTSVEMH